ncbi:MAG: hypothetical protein JXR49_19660 [Acidobacteria bacterium]|nr:hypothetical protein [Acidobacteriota bacterium]
MVKHYKKFTALVAVFIFISVSESSALTIVTRFIGGTPPANTSGSGNLTDIVSAAARMWESVYADPVTVTLDYGWASIPDAGNHIALGFNEQGNQELAGMLLFDNSGATPFYLDPTPNDNEEYQQSEEEYQDFGGGLINVARLFRQPTIVAAGYVDLLSVVLHEIGHSMGMSVGNYSFASQSTDGIILFSDRLPFAGTMAPLASNNTGFIPHFDVVEVAYGCLMSGINADERRIPSELDILANAQISGYTILSLTPSIESQSLQIKAFTDFWAHIWARFDVSSPDPASKTKNTRTGLNPRIIIWSR